jgi:hypothetical protein
MMRAATSALTNVDYTGRCTLYEKNTARRETGVFGKIFSLAVVVLEFIPQAFT